MKTLGLLGALVLGWVGGAGCDEAGHTGLDHDATTVTDAGTDTGNNTGTDTLPPQEVSSDVGPDAAPDVAAPSLVLTAEFETEAVVGRNELHIDLVDAEGAGVVGAVLQVVPMMPMHGHGSSETPVVSDEGAGHYHAYPVTFTMAGMWEVEITATAAGETATLTVEVDVP